MQPSVEVLNVLFEDAPRFVERLSREPCDSYEELVDRAQELAAQLPEVDQIELLNAHPRIGALRSTVSPISFREQGYGDDAGTAELQDRLNRLNDDYERRFGFRFVIFVAGRARTDIADVMEGRMSASGAAELERALSDVFAIARDRLKTLEPAPQEAR